jgi:hypothetical protein
MDQLRRLAALLFAIDIFFVVLFLLSASLGYEIDVFHLNGEMNFAAWWSGGKLLVAAAAIASVPMFAAERRAVPLLFYWAAAIGLAYLSADEILMLHERITSWNKENELGLPMFRGENGAWIGVYLVLFLFLILLFFRRIIIATKADPKSATLFGGGIVLSILGAVFGEIAGYYDFLSGRDSPLQLAVEEGLELFGVSFLLLGCIRHALLELRPLR